MTTTNSKMEIATPVEEEQELNTKAITEIELSYTTTSRFNIVDLDNADLWKSGKVKSFWVKWGTLYMKLHDGTVVEEFVEGEEETDVKWPVSTCACVDGQWEFQE